MDASHENDADLWLNLSSRLQAGLEQATALAAADLCPVDLTGDLQAAFAHWSRVCIRSHDPVDDLVNYWLHTGKMDEQHGPYRWFLKERFSMAWRFVRMFTYSRNHTTDPEFVTIFPFPRLAGDEVLRYLLKDWWLGTGLQISFELRAEGGGL